MKKNRRASILLSVALIVTLFAGCGNGTSDAESSASDSDAAAEDYEEGVSPSDDIVKTSPADKVILVVSFGTSFNQSRNLTIGAIEKAIGDAYPDYQIRRAFTAQIIIDKLAERDGLRIDNIEQAMDRLVLDGVKEVVIQPTTVMSGYEYDDVIAAIGPYADKFESMKVGKPLLTDDSDYETVTNLISEATADVRADDTAILWMGHGTHHAANATYPKLEELLHAKGCTNDYVGTVEGGVLIEDLQVTLKELGLKKVVMRPFMIVAGDHANNDMAGDDPESWKTILTNDGYTVETIIEGLGQIKGIQDLFVKHVRDAMDSESVSVTADAAGAAVKTAAAGLTADRIEDGVYAIEVDSDTSMFKFVGCELTVKDGSHVGFCDIKRAGIRQALYGDRGASAGRSRKSA